jgi:hypothetical protein
MDGIVGIYGPGDPELVNKTFLATGACQHRGKTSKIIGVDEVKYNTQERIQKTAGNGSFQALDASYPIDRKFWPDWLKREYDRYAQYKK